MTLSVLDQSSNFILIFVLAHAHYLQTRWNLLWLFRHFVRVRALWIPLIDAYVSLPAQTLLNVLEIQTHLTSPVSFLLISLHFLFLWVLACSLDVFLVFDVFVSDVPGSFRLTKVLCFRIGHSGPEHDGVLQLSLSQRPPGSTALPGVFFASPVFLNERTSKWKKQKQKHCEYCKKRQKQKSQVKFLNVRLFFILQENLTQRDYIFSLLKTV